VWHDRVTLYLYHIEPRYKHAGHYLGSTDREIAERHQEHMSGQGSPLIRAALAAGHQVTLVKTWPGVRLDEALLHQRKDTPRWCPVCTERRTNGGHVHQHPDKRHLPAGPGEG